MTPTDTEMLDWIERKGVTVTSFRLLGRVCWEVNGCDSKTRKNVQFSVEDTVREAVEKAMEILP